MTSRPRRALPGLGYETAEVTAVARFATWTVLLVMVLGALGSVALARGWLLTAAEAISFLIALPTFIVLLRRHGRIDSLGWTNVALLVVLPLAMTAYGAANAPLWGSHSVRGHWDEYVPTIPAFIVPYLGTYVWVVTTATFFAVRLLNRQLRTVLVAGILGVSTAIATFFLFQTDVDSTGLSQNAYGDFLGSWVQYMDLHMFKNPDYGDFPSVHVIWAVTLAIAWVRRERPVWAVGAAAMAVLIIIATQVLHQHSLMAATYGIVVATAMYSLSWLLLEYFPAMRRLRREGSTAFTP